MAKVPSRPSPRIVCSRVSQHPSVRRMNNMRVSRCYDSIITAVAVTVPPSLRVTHAPIRVAVAPANVNGQRRRSSRSSCSMHPREKSSYPAVVRDTISWRGVRSGEDKVRSGMDRLGYEGGVLSVKYPNSVEAAHLLPLSPSRRPFYHGGTFSTAHFSLDRSTRRRDSRDKQKLDGQREKGRANPFLPSSVWTERE